MTIISSGIYPIDPTITDGTQLAGYINELVEAVNSNQSSSTRPPMITKGGLWTKTLSGSDIAVMVYDGTKDYEIGKIVGGDIQLDSIWKEVGDVATYDGDIKVNGEDSAYVTVGKGKESIATNTAVGFRVLLNNLSGEHSTAVGFNGLKNNTSGKFNTAVGSGSMEFNNTGVENTAIGYGTLYNNSKGTNNTALGSASLRSNTEGDQNTAIGVKALNLNITGNGNTAVGRQALINSKGDNNVALGQNAGSTLTTGTNNILLGNEAQPTSGTVNDEVTIGADTITQVRFPALKLTIREFTSGTTTLNTYSTQKIGLGVGGTTHLDVSNSGTVEVKGNGVKYSGLTVGTGASSVIGFKWSGENGGTVVAVIDNTTSRKLVGSETLKATEEAFDKKLAIKDKIIESLADKLDKLEDILIANGNIKEKIALNVKDLIAEGEAEFQVYKEKLDEEAKKLQEKLEKAQQESSEKVVAKKKKK